MISVFHLKAPQRDLTPKKSMETMNQLMISPTDHLVSLVWHDMAEGLQYQLVATVDTDDMDEAFELTNSIDSYWGDNPGVHTTHESRHRSTSVGDVMQDSNDESYVVANFGFLKLN